MTTTEDFRNAPVGATATHNDGGRAMKMDYVERRWIVPNGFCLDDEEMERRDYTLDPLPPLPPFPLFPHITAREALALAWELAHPVKEGQTVPKGTEFITRSDETIIMTSDGWDNVIGPSQVDIVRTLDPLPDPEPDWLNAPAVIARCGYCSLEDHGLQITLHGRVSNGREWECTECQTATDWSNLRDVTPLYPKEGQEA